MSEQQPEPVDAPEEPKEVDPLFWQPESEWSTEQRPGHIESTRGDE